MLFVRGLACWRTTWEFQFCRCALMECSRSNRREKSLRRLSKFKCESGRRDTSQRELTRGKLRGSCRRWSRDCEARKKPGFRSNPGLRADWFARKLSQANPSDYGFTVTRTGLDEMPLATTKSALAPVSMVAGMSNSVETTALPVATAMV